MIARLLSYLNSGVFVPGVVLGTSAVAAFIAAKAYRLSGDLVKVALVRAVETLGLMAFFFLFNTLAGLVVVDGVKFLTHAFLSHYMILEWTLPWFSLFQALVLKYWIDSKRNPS